MYLTRRVGSFSSFVSTIADLSPVLDVALGRIAPDLRAEVVKVFDQTKASQSQKRSILLLKGVPRNIIDELEVLMDVGKWVLLMYFVGWMSNMSIDVDVDVIVNALVSERNDNERKECRDWCSGQT